MAKTILKQASHMVRVHAVPYWGALLVKFDESQGVTSTELCLELQCVTESGRGESREMDYLHWTMYSPCKTAQRARSRTHSWHKERRFPFSSGWGRSPSKGMLPHDKALLSILCAVAHEDLLTSFIHFSLQYFCKRKPEMYQTYLTIVHQNLLHDCRLWYMT